NGIPHQAMWPVAQRNPTMEPYYDEVYKLLPGKRFDRALIIGAGSGTDTAVALSHDVGSVRAGEIDPEIQRIGVARHPDQPYADPRVAVTIDDGRNFLRRTTDRFDLVIFAQTDSLTLVTTTANLRLESFLFTEEAFAAARDHLAPGGVFVLFYYYHRQWLGALDFGTLADRSCPGWELNPPLLRPRRRVLAPRDAEPRDLQPALRHDLVRQRAGHRGDPRERAPRDRGAVPLAGAPCVLLRRSLRDSRA